jgi:hypothetical protein
MGRVQTDGTNELFITMLYSCDYTINRNRRMLSPSQGIATSHHSSNAVNTYSLLNTNNLHVRQQVPQTSPHLLTTGQDLRSGQDESVVAGIP